MTLQLKAFTAALIGLAVFMHCALPLLAAEPVAGRPQARQAASPAPATGPEFRPFRWPGIHPFPGM